MAAAAPNSASGFVINPSNLNYAEGSVSDGATSQLIAKPGGSKKIIIYSILLGGILANGALLTNNSIGGPIVSPSLFHAADQTIQIVGAWVFEEDAAVFWDPDLANAIAIRVGYKVSGA